MRSSLLFAILLGAHSQSGAPFSLGPVLNGRLCRPSQRAPICMSAGPTLEELAKDPFMKQISHAGKIVKLMEDGQDMDPDELRTMLISQLSHSDGIRGFFVTYLTGDASPADGPTVPSVLQEAMAQVEPDELVPLACMNVIMPTAMITLHEDPELSKQSRITADRGIRILEVISNIKEVKENCHAILSVATGSPEDAEPGLVEFWTTFFEKWGYKEAQKKDIVLAVNNVLGS